MRDVLAVALLILLLVVVIEPELLGTQWAKIKAGFEEAAHVHK